MKTVKQLSSAITYTDKVFQHLIGMKFNTPVSMADMSEENREKMSVAVQRFIDSDYGRRQKPPFEIKFSSDKMSIKKFGIDKLLFIAQKEVVDKLRKINL